MSATPDAQFAAHRVGSPLPLPGAGLRVSVIIPALDEEASIGLVLADLPWPLLQEVIVADNGSRDGTAAEARAAGARVVSAPRRGYGSACLAGLAALLPTDVVVFLDGDHSDHADELPLLLEPIVQGRASVVLGSRVLGVAEPGALLPQQILGNRLATALLALIFGHRYTDLGPFRAVRADVLPALDLKDKNWGFTVELQVRALQAGLTVLEVPVSYRRRIGRSKIAGTLRGTLAAGTKIIYTILALAVTRGRPRSGSSRSP